IRQWSERNTIALRHRADTLVARLAVSFTRLGGEMNKVTGYDEIEELKRQVVSQEVRISASRKAARNAKAAYEEAVQNRSDSQREVNSLLERKSMWTDADVSRFTALLRQERALEQEESLAKITVAQTEDEVEREFSALMRTILARYHEEQVWSDKIRSVSTYGQLAVLGVNVFVFVLAIVLVEPWKRRRLTQAFERKVQELEATNLDAVTKGMNALQNRLEEQQVKVLAGLRGFEYAFHTDSARTGWVRSGGDAPGVGVCWYQSHQRRREIDRRIRDYWYIGLGHQRLGRVLNM
ncbi:Mdm33 family-domain-containing protein, partial [Lactifluus volemus]